MTVLYVFDAQRRAQTKTVEPAQTQSVPRLLGPIAADAVFRTVIDPDVATTGCPWVPDDESVT